MNTQHSSFKSKIVPQGEVLKCKDSSENGRSPLLPHVNIVPLPMRFANRQSISQKSTKLIKRGASSEGLSRTIVFTIANISLLNLSRDEFLY